MLCWATHNPTTITNLPNTPPLYQHPQQPGTATTSPQTQPITTETPTTNSPNHHKHPFYSAAEMQHTEQPTTHHPTQQHCHHKQTALTTTPQHHQPVIPPSHQNPSTAEPRAPYPQHICPSAKTMPTTHPLTTATHPLPHYQTNHTTPITPTPLQHITQANIPTTPSLQNTPTTHHPRYHTSVNKPHTQQLPPHHPAAAPHSITTLPTPVQPQPYLSLTTLYTPVPLIPVIQALPTFTHQPPPLHPDPRPMTTTNTEH